MNFTKTDMVILISMSIAVVALSFTMPALGMTGENVTSNEIPSYNQSAYTFNFVNEFPENPHTPSQGVLIRNESRLNPNQLNVRIAGDTTDGVEMTLFPDGTNGSKVNIVHWISGTDYIDTVYLNETGDTYHYKNDTSGWHIYFTYDKLENRNTSTATRYIGWEITQQPSDTTWYARIPLVGGLFSTADQLAGIVGYIGVVIWWFSATLLEISINVIGILVSVLVFAFGLVSWLVGAYTGIITGAESWAAVFVLLPGILLSLELAKLTFIGIKLLPTT